MVNNMADEEIMTAERGKGFTIFRGDTARLENGKIKGTLYDIGKSLRTSIGRRWTTSHKKAIEFACQYAEGTKYPIAPIVYHGVANKVKKGFFWRSEREVHITRGGRSILKNIEIIYLNDCKKIMEELRDK